MIRSSELKETDLTIGFTYKLKGGVSIDENVFTLGFSEIQANGMSILNKIEGAGITTDRLLSMGFSKTSDDWYDLSYTTEDLYGNQTLIIIYNVSTNRFGICDSNEEECFYTHGDVYYVHELERLVLGITNKLK